LSPILLERARAIAAEHQQLSDANAETYDVATAKKIGELGPVVSALKDWEDAQSVGYSVETLGEPYTDNSFLIVPDRARDHAPRPILGC
jgi:peptide chain release factor 1